MLFARRANHSHVNTCDGACVACNACLCASVLDAIGSLRSCLLHTKNKHMHTLGSRATAQPPHDKRQLLCRTRTRTVATAATISRASPLIAQRWWHILRAKPSAVCVPFLREPFVRVCTHVPVCTCVCLCVRSSSRHAVASAIATFTFCMVSVRQHISWSA